MAMCSEVRIVPIRNAACVGKWGIRFLSPHAVHSSIRVYPWRKCLAMTGLRGRDLADARELHTASLGEQGAVHELLLQPHHGLHRGSTMRRLELALGFVGEFAAARTYQDLVRPETRILGVDLLTAAQAIHSTPLITEPRLYPSHL